MSICGVILSGGQSSRMGTNKALLDINHVPVIERIANELKKCTDEVVIISNEPEKYDFLNLKIYEDRYKHQGPLAGIESALYHVNADVFMIAACDMPFVTSHIYQLLLSQIDLYDAVVPVYDDQTHPLAGIYRRTVLPKIQEQLDQDIRKVKRFFKHINVHYVDHFESSEVITKKHFFNMNHPEQYEEAKSLEIGLKNGDK